MGGRTGTVCTVRNGAALSVDEVGLPTAVASHRAGAASEGGRTYDEEPKVYPKVG